ncbi:hypothetical protein [Parashewanella tropica]|uniref:hypothetical protein n=1 Tax=Parashewanella tropica TaxID=2547970 RepID=UPI0010594DD1|nr:hypothetical protein [Parashewanella tropica]
MSLSKINNNKFFSKSVLITGCILGLSACGSDSGSGSGSKPATDKGYVKFYNASETAPEVFLTIDENPNSSKDDHFERTYSGVEYSKAGINHDIPVRKHTYELAWQDGTSTKRDDLKLFNKGEVKAEKGKIKLLVLTNTIDAPQVEKYTIDVINTDQDKKDKVFDIRALNLYSNSNNYELHVSKGNETFKEATKVATVAYKGLSDSKKLKYDDYVFYITEAGKTDVVYQSEKVTHKHTSQYVMVIRKNTGSGSSPVTLDRVAGSSTVEYVDHDAEAKYKVYNGIQKIDLLPDYNSSVDFFLGSVDDTPDVANLMLGKRSESIKHAKGDYGVDITNAGTKKTILKNHLLSLEKNSNKTIFLYVDEINGENDKKDHKVNTLIVKNDRSLSLYDQKLALLNLVDSDDFSQARFYFVRSDETIDTAKLNKTVRFGENESINLINNSYKVYAIASQNSSRLVLASFDLTINKDSKEQFLVLEKDADSSTGYIIRVLKRS